MAWVQLPLLVVVMRLLNLCRSGVAVTVQKPHIVYFLVDDL